MSTKQYSQATLEHAIGLVKSGSMSLNGARKMFNIPFSTLRDKVRGRRPIQAKPKFLLTEEEEDGLVNWIRVFAERSMGRCHKEVRDKVRDIVALRGGVSRREDGRPGKDWMISFKRRHPEITLRTPQSLGKERALVSEGDVRQWFSRMKDYLDSVDPHLIFSADRLFIADETGFPLCPSSKRVLAPTGIKHLYNISNSTRQQLTVLCCASAAGEYINPLIVFPRKRMPSFNLLEGFDGAFMQISPNGWVNSLIFETWIRDVFIPFVENKKKPVVLFVDGHTSHNSNITCLELCNEHGIILYGLLPHASHILQPLDLTVFGSMKSTWPEIVKKHLEATGETPSMASFAQLLRSLWDLCAKPEASLKGFVRAGIFPFDPDTPLASGKMESAKSFSPSIFPSASSSSTSSALPPSVPPSPLPSSSSSAAAATVALPSTCETTFKFKVQHLLELSHTIGLERSVEYLEIMEAQPLPDNEVFREFSHAVLALKGKDAKNAGSSAPVRDTARPQTLAEILSPPQLQRNKSGKVPQKSASLSMAFSSEEHRDFLKRKEEKATEEQEAKEKRKSDREKMRENHVREKREKAEKLRLERENKKREKQRMKEEDKQRLRMLKQKERKKSATARKDSTSGDENERVNMVLESDREDVEMVDSSKCRKCGKADCDMQ